MHVKRFHYSTSSSANHCCSKVHLLSTAATVSLLFISLIFAAVAPQATATGKQLSILRWYKGNLHTHSLWSDGNDYPEMVVEWYKRNSYHFLALSDHNILSQGRKWIDAADNRAGEEGFRKYLERFGKKWVEQRTIDDKRQVRLKPLSEFRCLFEEPDRFLLIQAEEITDTKKAHVNAINLCELVRPQGGDTTAEILQNNINAVLAQRQRTGQAMFPHINHPNYKWAVMAEDIMSLKGEKFFEVYNGHPKVYNYGDRYHAGTERMWDIILTKRLAELHLPIMYGIATDDAHNYRQYGQKRANPGRGWVMVRACHLTAESIIKAMEAGDFYASTGVVLKDICFDGKTLKIVIEPEKDASYTTQFIGTLKGCDLTGRAVTDANGVELGATRIYSDDIGRVLAELKGAVAGYTLTGSEIYVRAKVTSTKAKENSSVERDVEVAWVQPVIPDGK